MADCLPYQGIMTDMRWLSILYFDTRDITILPYGDLKKGPHNNLFSDARGKIAASRWGYDGNLNTALSEFHQRGFRFNLAKLPSNLEENGQWMKQYLDNLVDRRISGIMTETNLPFEQVLTVIAQNPQT